MQLHTDIASWIYDLGLISGFECQNGRSSWLDIKLEINNGVLQMGIVIFGDMQYTSAEFENINWGKTKICNFIVLSMFSKSSENHQGKVTSIGRKATCSQKAQNICEYWGGVGKLISWYNPRRQNVIDLTF